MKTQAITLALLLSATALPGLAQTTDHGAHHAAPKPAAAAPAAGALPQAEGEVRRVDTAANKISLKHGEIKNLDMPPMTMVFQVSDPALLGKVKAGDKVRFTADQINGAYTVMSIETAP
jgi:Cu/Ag efflux protein CusF